MENIKQMVRSDDPEIAILGAKLMLQQDEKEALKLSNLKHYMDFYKDKKGEFHNVRSLSFNSSIGHIHILSQVELERILQYDASDWDWNIDNKIINLIKQEYEHSKGFEIKR